MKINIEVEINGKIYNDFNEIQSLSFKENIYIMFIFKGFRNDEKEKIYFGLDMYNIDKNLIPNTIGMLESFIKSEGDFMRKILYKNIVELLSIANLIKNVEIDDKIYLYRYKTIIESENEKDILKNILFSLENDINTENLNNKYNGNKTVILGIQAKTIFNNIVIKADAINRTFYINDFQKIIYLNKNKTKFIKRKTKFEINRNVFELIKTMVEKNDMKYDDDEITISNRMKNEQFNFYITAKKYKKVFKITNDEIKEILSWYEENYSY